MRGIERKEPVESKEPNVLSAYKKNVTSQCGEDGVIERIFEIIKGTDKWCVEFGAGDGKTISNTYNLITNKGWQSVQIESDLSLYKKLLQTYKNNDKVICINNQISFDDPNTLDAILIKTPIPRTFDFLCIDIDGNDYHIWDSIEKYEPKVVAIEFNPTIPADIEFVQLRNMGLNQGSSLLSLVKLGKQKGYELIAALDWNAFFVKKEYFELFGIRDNAPYLIRREHNYETRIFQLYDGTLVLEGCQRLIWHNIEIDQNKIQVLPRPLRKYPGKMNFLQINLINYIQKGLIGFILEKAPGIIRKVFKFTRKSD